MIKAQFLVLLLILLPSFAQAQQGTPVTLTLAGDGTATAAGANYAITFSGTAMLSGFAPAMFYANGTANLITVATTGNVSADFAMLFANGDALVGQITVPAGYLVPALGQTAAAGEAYDQAIGLEADPAVRRFLQKRRTRHAQPQ